jgi:signal transduction histidine kinase
VAERLGIAQQAGEEIREIARVLGMLAREPLDAGVVDVRDVAAEVASAAEALNIVRGLELVQVLGPDPVPVALGAAQLRHALLLLVACAFQSCGRQGPLLVEVGAADGKAEIAVRHSGAGVAEQPEVDPGFEHVAAWASARGGSAARERTRVTLALPLAR